MKQPLLNKGRISGRNLIVNYQVSGMTSRNKHHMPKKLRHALRPVTQAWVQPATVVCIGEIGYHVDVLRRRLTGAGGISRERAVMIVRERPKPHRQVIR